MRGGRRQIFIELTALLDVILIMLFVILVQAQGQTAAARDTVEAAQMETEELRQENETLRRQVFSRDIVLDNSLLLTISADKSGTIRLEQPESDPVEMAYSRKERNYVSNKLRTALDAALAADDRETVFLVFQYDRNRIYQAEYVLVSNVVQEIKREIARSSRTLNYLELDINTGEQYE